LFSSLRRSALSQKAKIAVSQAETNLTETQERILIEVQAAENEYQSNTVDEEEPPDHNQGSNGPITTL
jgi:hypothetical protein